MIHIQFLEKIVLKLLNMSKAFTLELNKNPYSWYLNEFYLEINLQTAKMYTLEFFKGIY